MKFYNKYYIHSGNTAVARCIESTALRIDTDRSVPDDMQQTFRRKSKTALVHEIAERKRLQDSSDFSTTSEGNQINPAHERILRELLEDDGEDQDLAQQFLEDSDIGFEPTDGSKERRGTILEEYIQMSSRPVGFDVDNEEANPLDGIGEPIQRNSFQDKIRRSSFAVQKALLEEFNMNVDGDNDDFDGMSDFDGMADSQSSGSDFMDDNRVFSV